MDFYPHGTRAFRQPIRAYTRLDAVARHFDPERQPKHRRGKFRKDDSGAKSVRDYLEEKYLHAHIWKRRGRYQPSWVCRNFFR